MSKYVHINYRIVDKHMNRVFIIHTNEKFLSKFCLFIFLTLVYEMKKKNLQSIRVVHLLYQSVILTCVRINTSAKITECQNIGLR